MKILICEDEEIMLTALEFRLQRQGLKVVVAKDGKEAIELIARPDTVAPPKNFSDLEAAMKNN